VIGHLSSHGEGAKRAESDWQVTVILGCPRWKDGENKTFASIRGREGGKTTLFLPFSVLERVGLSQLVD
jgi:hypothetical protein